MSFPIEEGSWQLQLGFSARPEGARWRRSATRSHRHSTLLRRTPHCVPSMHARRLRWASPRRSRGCSRKPRCPRRSRRSASCSTPSPRTTSPSSQPTRAPRSCTGIAASAPEAKLGVRQLRALTFLFFYGLPDENGQNPNWEAIGYPGPLSPAPTSRAGAEDDLCGERHGRERDLAGRRLRGRFWRRRWRDRRRAGGAQVNPWWCSRWAVIAMSPTSTSSSCRACSSCISAAASRAPRTARSRSSPARRSAAARSSTT